MEVEGVVAGQNMATAAFGLLNAAYFAHYWWRRNGSRGRRVGAAALALVSVAAVVEAFFALCVVWSQQGVAPFGEVGSGAWAVERIPLLVTTAFISLLIMRRLRA